LVSTQKCLVVGKKNNLRIKLGRIVLGGICSSFKVVLLGRTVRKENLDRNNNVTNRRGASMQWRGRR